MRGFRDPDLDLARIEEIVQTRKAGAPAGSYVASLLAKGDAAVQTDMRDILQRMLAIRI